MAAIFWMSSRSTLPVPVWFPHQDKLAHAVVYFVLAILFWRSARHVIQSPLVLAWVSVGLASLYGVSDEWHQSFVEGRSADWLDWLADTVGAGLGVFCIYQMHKFLLE